MKLKKTAIIFALSIATAFQCFGQLSPKKIDSLKDKLVSAKSDTSRLSALMLLVNGYRFSNVDSTLYYNDRALALSRKIDSAAAEARCLSDRGSLYLESGNIPKGLSYLLAGLKRIENSPPTFQNQNIYGGIENRIGNVYMELGEYKTAIAHYRITLNLAVKYKNPAMYNELSNIGNIYEMMGQLDSAQVYQRKAYAARNKLRGTQLVVFAEMEHRMGTLQTSLGHYDTALTHYSAAVHEAIIARDLRNLSVTYFKMAGLFKKLNLVDSAFYYAHKTLEVSRLVSMKKSEYQASELLSGLFKARRQPDSALYYAEHAALVKDQLYGPKVFQQLQLINLQEQQRQQQLQQQNDELRYRYIIIAVVSGLVVILLVAFIIWRNYRKQKSTNLLLHEQKEEIASQRDALDNTLQELKQTQSQLIQSEKMASLGELTAGIAHEIQNPLNFVNNFSEVNTEMLEELKAESLKPKAERDEQLQIELINDLIENEQKINHHGKRADGIVKGMLEHSRASTGQKEPTDLNKLADEYLRLAYHGLRAKDKNFNAELITHFEENLPKANVVSQDFGRVLLNLFNNAFYAVKEKAKTAGPDYKPTVQVTTSTPPSGGWGVSVRDNGSGIPDDIKDKIMQPFFTTKPTGEGTGLGLSLSYDIVVKGHGGTISLNTNEGQGTEFTITIPK